MQDKAAGAEAAYGGEDWKRRGLASGFMITPTGHVIHINEWPGLEEWMARHSKKDTARGK